MLHWLSTATSVYLLHPLTGRGYQFWSGAGSDFGEITILVAILGWYHHHNCGQPRCWRLGHPHPDPDHPHHGLPVCRRHWHVH